MEISKEFINDIMDAVDGCNCEDHRAYLKNVLEHYLKDENKEERGR